VIVGGGLAGAKAAAGAREVGFAGRIILLGDEPMAPYERPPLSKAVLRGEAAPETAAVHAAGWYAANDVELEQDARVMAIEPAARVVTLDGGRRIRYSTAVLATGATPRRLRGPGCDLAGVHYLRTLGDAVELRDAIRTAERVVVIGAGWIGSEVAASARTVGGHVTLIDPGPLPLHRVLGPVGQVFADLHRRHGVHLRLGTGVRALRGFRRVTGVELADGTVEAADLVVVGIGVVPNTGLATEAGLLVDDGIVVDEHLESSAPGVFAAGDVASAFHPLYQRHVRVEHWANALNQGAAAGRNAVGKKEIYARLPYFFSDQYDLGMEYVGLADPNDDVVIRGDQADAKFIAFWQRRGVVTAAMNVNVWDVVEDLRSLIASRRQIDPRRLADAAVPLSSLVAR
jgi:3-phenylpropionate/trans-cinnamate dioxygenase ferredoxin reductase subunit